MPKTPTAATEADGVHTRAQPTEPKPAKPKLHMPTPLHPRDEHTGKGGSYVRDPATGERRRVAPNP